MDERLARADAALRAGQSKAAIEQLSSLLNADPLQPAPVYRALLVELYRTDRIGEGASWGEVAAQQHPGDVEILNMLGVMYRRLGRASDALAALDQAARLDPKSLAVQTNRGNVLLDLDDAPRAEAVFTNLMRADPRNAEYQRQLARALIKQGRPNPARARLRQALLLKKDSLEIWLDLIGLENDAHRTDEAQALIDRALAILPDHPRLLEARIIVLRRAGQMAQSQAYALELLQRFPNAAWLHVQLGNAVVDQDRERANVHMRKAVELEPGRLDYQMTLIESLERTRSGDEGANIEEAYQLARRVAGSLNKGPGYLKILNEVLIRVCAFDEVDQLGDFKSLGRSWALSNRHSALLKQLARVRTLEDRYELLEQHRIWGQLAEAAAATSPIKRPPRRAGGGKIRIGFMSSDLRNHPVGYFALPLFEHVDPQRFEIYCYSFYQGAKADQLQEFFAARSKAYRWEPGINSPGAAQMIADDQLDFLIELGGTTHMNRLDVMAYRPAPLQASWLGYPHSSGLSEIDYLITDPFNTPPRRDLLIEEPLVMPKSWIALGRMVFSDRHGITPGLPEERNGYITFGTANNPHKYGREVIAVWSQVMNATPNSRFLFVRPESGSQSFRRNLVAEFQRNGVEPARIAFTAVRGAHMQHYNEIDVSLDTFPLTGGTTTTEALWMGVPVVSLRGEAFFERLSASILANCGLSDLVSDSRDEFVRAAVDLAGDRSRRLALREGLRERMRSGPLGQTETFAQDFYDLITRTVGAR